MKRKLSLSLIIILVFSMVFSGCAKMTELTSDQNDMVANYLAKALVTATTKHFLYEPNIVHVSKEDETTEAETLPEENETETDADGNPVSNTGNGSGGATGNGGNGGTGGNGNGGSGNGGSENGGSGAGGSGTGSNSGTGEEQETVSEEKLMQDMASVIGMEYVKITYVDSVICDEFPLDEDAYFVLNSEKGKRLVVVTYRIFNASPEDLVYSSPSSEEAIPFRIVVDESHKIRSFKNILRNDIGNLHNFTIPTNDSREIIIVFHLTDDEIAMLNDITVQYMMDEKYITLPSKEIGLVVEREGQDITETEQIPEETTIHSGK